MSPTGVMFESAHSHLRPGQDTAVVRRDAEPGAESSAGDMHLVVMGGGVAVRLLDGRSKCVSTPLRVEEVEMLKFMALSSLSGES